MAIYDVNGKIIGGEPKRYNILEYNVGNFDVDGYAGNDLDGYTATWAKFIGKCNADICMFSESRKYIDHGDTKTPTEVLYSKLYDNVLTYNPSTKWGEALMSNSQQSQQISGKYVNQRSSESKYVGALINLNGVDVYVVSTHLIHDGTNNTDIRVAEMAELVALVSEYDNVIIGGDFNTTDLSELTTLTNAGFTFANGGLFGENNTFEVGNMIYPLDNVGIRGSKLKLQSYEILDTVTLSDHVPTITGILVG
jgi:endonuclease/exonuclease/phosphatase family metal-dependent hydrolase